MISINAFKGFDSMDYSFPSLFVSEKIPCPPDMFDDMYECNTLNTIEPFYDMNFDYPYDF